MTETYDITLPVLVAVSQLPNACFYRVNCGAFRTMDVKRVVQSVSVEGVADIMGTYRGFSIALETKTRTGKQLKTQRIFQKNHERAGGIYIIARSEDEAVCALLAL